MCGESRMHGVEVGKIWKPHKRVLRITYTYSFFADPTIYTLTSGTPSQNVDLGGFSFPRRMGVRLHPDFMEGYGLTGLQCVWQAFSDQNFQKSLGKEFYHEDIIGREGWCMFYFKGIFPERNAYLRCEIRNPQTGILVKRLFFKFEKSYQKTLDGRNYMLDPVLEQKIVKNGTLIEMKPTKLANGVIRFVEGHLMFKSDILDYRDGVPIKLENQDVPVVRSNIVFYSERPKALFMITPPHLLKYAKLLLIAITQLTNLNFEKSYMTKSSQKPLYKTRYMLDNVF